VLDLLNKRASSPGAPDLGHVIQLASERPVFGWGWVSYWPPFVSPFNSKHFNIGGVQYSQGTSVAGCWLQLGIVGLVVFGALV